MIASVSLDLDNKWSYLKTHGDEGWDKYPTYLPTLVPRVLELLDRLQMKITFFIVGRDAIRDENLPALSAIAQHGHEIGNHSFQHEPWLHLYSYDQLVEEFERSEQAIQGATGQRTIGFRGPGFSYSSDVLKVLASRGYRYDASTFPTFLGPIARAYYFFHSRLQKQEREKRKELFGSAQAGFMRLRPYRWPKEMNGLIEIPVTTMPWFKVPIHLSYVMYLACYSTALAKTYFRNALRFCWLNRVEPSLLLHPLDFLGGDEESDLAFFPAMSLPTSNKMKVAEQMLGFMRDQFECLTMLEHATRLESRLPIKPVAN